MLNKRFKIAKVINAEQVVINGGRNHGIHINDIFEILDSSDITKIKDPVTDEIIGEFPKSKGTVEITEVYDKMSIARTPKVDVFKDKFGNDVFNKREKLNVDIDDSHFVNNIFDKSDVPVKIGDDVIKKGDKISSILDDII